MTDYFKVYESLIKHNYINNLFEIGVAHNSQIGENSPHLYIKHLFNENERLNAENLNLKTQLTYNIDENGHLILIITNLNTDIINLKQQIEQLKNELAITNDNLQAQINYNATAHKNQNQNQNSNDKASKELTEEIEFLNHEKDELLEHRIRLQKSNAYWINSLFRFMLKTPLKMKYSSEILQMQDTIINNFKDTPKVVERTKEIINEFFKK